MRRIIPDVPIGSKCYFSLAVYVMSQCRNPSKIDASNKIPRSIWFHIICFKMCFSFLLIYKSCERKTSFHIAAPSIESVLKITSKCVIVAYIAIT